jgi:hypothetical protein
MEPWLLAVAGVGLLGTALVGCRVCLLRRIERIRGLWDDIYFRLRERCQLVSTLNVHLRSRLKADHSLADDIQYLLNRMEQTSDPHTHAAVQNGLVLTVQTAVEQFHRSDDLRLDSDMHRVMHDIAVVDSRLAPLRDRFNDAVRGYNKLVTFPVFSLVARMTQAEERKLFSMLIPWWSTDPAAYGSVTTEQLRYRLQTQRAPLILAPSQRIEWSGGPRVIQVRDKLMGRPVPEPDPGPSGGGTPSSNGARNGRSPE